MKGRQNLSPVTSCGTTLTQERFLPSAARPQVAVKRVHVLELFQLHHTKSCSDTTPAATAIPPPSPAPAEVSGWCECPVPTPGSRSPPWSTCPAPGQPDNLCWSCSPGWGTRTSLSCWRGWHRDPINPGGCKSGQEKKGPSAGQEALGEEKALREGREDSPNWGEGRRILSLHSPLLTTEGHSGSDQRSRAGTWEKGAGAW